MRMCLLLPGSPAEMTWSISPPRPTLRYYHIHIYMHIVQRWLYGVFIGVFSSSRSPVSRPASLKISALKSMAGSPGQLLQGYTHCTCTLYIVSVSRQTKQIRIFPRKNDLLQWNWNCIIIIPQCPRQTKQNSKWEFFQEKIIYLTITRHILEMF